MMMEVLITGGRSGRKYSAVGRAFQIVSTSLLSLLLPLSILLLARLSTAHYLLSVSHDYPLPQPAPFLCSLFLHTTTAPTLLHFLLSIIIVSSLTHALTGRFTALFTGLESGPTLPLTRSRSRSRSRSHLVVAWALLILVQLCVGLGVEGSIASGIDGSRFGQENSFMGRILFFLGLHEAMMFWGATVVKPVVDDTIFGGGGGGDDWRMVEKMAVGLGYGGFWWWRLREEVEALVMVPELKRELAMQIGAADFIGWWLYYLTVTIGMVRLVKGFGLTFMILTRTARSRILIIQDNTNNNNNNSDSNARQGDDKV